MSQLNDMSIDVEDIIEDLIILTEFGYSSEESIEILKLGMKNGFNKTFTKLVDSVIGNSNSFPGISESIIMHSDKLANALSSIENLSFALEELKGR